MPVLSVGLTMALCHSCPFWLQSVKENTLPCIDYACWVNQYLGSLMCVLIRIFFTMTSSKLCFWSEAGYRLYYVYCFQSEGSCVYSMYSIPPYATYTSCFKCIESEVSDMLWKKGLWWIEICGRVFFTLTELGSILQLSVVVLYPYWEHIPASQHHCCHTVVGCNHYFEMDHFFNCCVALILVTSYRMWASR